MNTQDYINTVKQIKSEILKTRYLIARIANRELLSLYFKIGKLISKKVAAEKWGSKTIRNLSNDLQAELNGLRGFSYANLKKMRQFYEEWNKFIQLDSGDMQIGSSITSQLKNSLQIGSLSTSQLGKQTDKDKILVIERFFDAFQNVGFTAHYETFSKVKTLEERIFYIIKTADNYWTVETLRYQLNNNLYEQQAKLPNNFEKTVTKKDLQSTLNTFKDQYLLDFITLSDEEQDDERVFENKIVTNIKKFLMSLGNDFAFIGNQYRLIVAGEEYFIDLLFFHRRLKALVAFELKTGKFKPEYLGKMNFYLSALDEYVKQPDENPSIGIILCKEKNNTIVEFAFRDFNKAMGVATYKTAKRLPKQYKNILPDANSFKEIINNYNESEQKF